MIRTLRVRQARTFRNLLSLGVSTAVLAVAVPSVTLAQTGAIEEVVVTGSFIRRSDSFDLPTPIDVLDQADIAEKGTPNLGEIIRNSPYNYGVGTVTNILAAAPSSGAVPAANFRGLGETATLTLLDGRRTLTQNLANLYPQILISRVESLTAGGSVIYGTDAVGGVMNIIPRKDFEGLEVSGSYNSATQGEWDEFAWAVIGGLRTDSSRFVGAFEYRDRDQLKFFDRKQYSLGAASWSTTPWPGNFRVPNRGPDGGGAITSLSQRRDPGCGLNNESTSKADGVLGRRQGTALAATTCVWEFGENFNYQPQVETFTSVGLFEHQFTDHISFESEVLFNRTVNTDRGSPSNPGGRFSELPVIPGEHPGNPYRAFVDVNNNGVFEPDAGDQLLFAQPRLDSMGNPVLDNLGRMIPARDPDSNQVILAANQFASMDEDPTGGIPFNEDVTVVAWRPVGYPFVGPSRSNRDRTGRGDADFKANNFRWVGAVNFEIPDTTWTGFADYVFHRNEFVGFGGRVESLSAISAGFQGELLVRDPATGSSRLAWFNPFASQNFACENRDCSGGNQQPLEVPDPNNPGAMMPNPAVNHTEVYDLVARFEPPTILTTMNAARLFVTGDVVDLPAGPLAVAVGGGWTRTIYDFDGGGTSNALDAFIGIGSPDFSEGRTVLSGVFEVRAPIFDNDTLGSLELNAAVRQEWVSDNAVEDLDHTDYQVAFRWQALDWLAIRASWSTAFISPSLPDLFAPVTLALSNVTDPFLGIGAFIPRTLGGTVSLKPEEADIYNLGFSVQLLDGDLNFSFDWKFFDFEDRIIRPVPQEVVNADRDAAIAAGFPITPAGLAAWLASGQADPRVARSPTSLEIEFVETPLVNAQTMEWKGFDLGVSYRFDGSQLPFIDREIGRFGVGLNTTYVQNYSFIRSEGGEKIEGAGKRNNGTAAVPPMPRWRGNLRFGWDMDRHGVVVLGRYMHEVKRANEEDPFCAPGIVQFIHGLMQATNECPTKLPRHIEWDVTYTLDLDGLVWGERRSTVSLGLLNAFDKEPKPMITLGGLESRLYDPRGRIWFARFTQQL
jgi:iron complex outermembrane recepter protein